MTLSEPIWSMIDDVRGIAGPQPEPGTIWNVSACSTKLDVVLWTDSHADAVAIIEAGYPQVLALIQKPGRDRLRALADAAVQDVIGRMGKAILACADRRIEEELARRFGRHRCWRVRWPEGCSGAVELAGDAKFQAIRAAIEAAEPWPIAGVIVPTGAEMLEHRHAPLPPMLTTGCHASDLAMAIPSDGRLIFITGIPNHGKSTWALHVAAHVASRHGRKWAIFSPEMAPWTNIGAGLLAWRAGKPFRPQGDMAGMSDAEITDGAGWLHAHFRFIAHDSLDETLTLPWLLERIAACVLRDGVTDFLIDPWNELEHGRGSATEAEYLNRSLQQLRAFCARHGVNAWVIAHPVKLRPIKPGEPIPLPTPYDVAGGAAWANKADLLIVVHRPDVETEIHVAKARFRRYGERGAVARLTLDRLTGRFRSASVEDAYADPLP